MSGIMAGDKLPCYRSDVLREFPFPECLGSREHRLGENWHNVEGAMR